MSVVLRGLLGLASVVSVCGSTDGPLLLSVAHVPVIWPKDASSPFILAKDDTGVESGQEVRRSSPGQPMSLRSSPVQPKHSLKLLRTSSSNLGPEKDLIVSETVLGFPVRSFLLLYLEW